jgi:uncharacterized membrane protein
MSFLNPLLVLAGLGVAVPILAHLLNRDRVKHTDWAAMQFLNRSIRIRARQLRLRDLILMLLRCLAVLLLAFALAQPGSDSPSGIGTSLGEPQAGVVIALDRSFSMQHSERWDRALEQVAEIAASIPPGAPVSLVTLGDSHLVLARSMAYKAERFDALVEGLAPSAEPLKLETVPAILSELLADTDALRKEVYLITDLQARDWAKPTPWLREALGDLRAQAEVTIIPIQSGSDNLAINEFELFSGLLRKGTMARYQATVTNHGSEPVHDVRIRCLMAEINVDSKIIPVIGPRASETVSFFVPFHNAGAVPLTAALDKDSLPLDNERRTVATIRERVAVLCVEGDVGEGFIAKALSARGNAADKEEFTVRSVSWLSLPSQDLSAYDVVVFSDVPEITPELASQLSEYVRAGNGLIWFPGDNIKAAVWNTRALLPATIGQTDSVSNELGTGRPIDPILLDHPVCRPLRSLPKDLLSEAQFRQLLQVDPAPSSSTLLHLSGSTTPLLLANSVGRGHIFMFTSSASPAWNNMALTPVFPMLLQQAVTYLTGREFETAALVGGALSLSYAERPDASDGVFETPSGEVIRVPVREHGGRYIAFLDHASEAGFYTARVSVQSPGHPIAVNVDPGESDVRCLDPENLQLDIRVANSASEVIGELRTSHSYSRAAMIGVLLFLLLESLLATRGRIE